MDAGHYLKDVAVCIMKIREKLLKLLSFKDLFMCILLQFSDSFIDKCTQLVPGMIEAPHVF